MSRRLVFLAGSCSGLIVGAVLVLLVVANGVDNRPQAVAPTASAVVLPQDQRTAGLGELHLQLGAPPSPVVIPQDHRQPAVPKDWVERDFNGLPYYNVPLKATVIAR